MSIFHAYDVRGIVGDELNEENYYVLGAALVEQMQKGDNAVQIASPIVVGYDGRTNSERFAQAFTDALIDRGVDVIFIGLCSTPMVYFAIHHLDAGGGAMVTASHNPKEYNGLKLSGKLSAPISPTGQTKTMIDFYERHSIKEITVGQVTEQIGKVRQVNLRNDYTKFLLKFTQIAQPLKIVADAGNGVASIGFFPLSQNLGCQIIPMYMQIDGEFPNHEANPAKEETLENLQRVVKEHNADFGVAFDGDADRIGFVDENGKTIPADVIACLVADNLLKEHPGRHIVHELRCTQALQDVIAKHNATATRTKVGRPAIISAMNENHLSLFGIERSGHFFFGDFYNKDEPLIMFLHVANIVSDSPMTLSELCAPYQKFFALPEINIKTHQTQAALDAVRTAFAKQGIDELDGVSVKTDEYSFNIRPSNTEPLIRITLEAINEQKALEIKQQLLQLVEHNSSV